LKKIVIHHHPQLDDPLPEQAQCFEMCAYRSTCLRSAIHWGERKDIAISYRNPTMQKCYRFIDLMNWDIELSRKLPTCLN
jgi:hypothetical protein